MYAPEPVRAHLLRAARAAVRRHAAEHDDEALTAARTIEAQIAAAPANDPLFARLAEAWQEALPGGGIDDDGWIAIIVPLPGPAAAAWRSQAIKAEGQFQNAISAHRDGDLRAIAQHAIVTLGFFAHRSPSEAFRQAMHRRQPKPATRLPWHSVSIFMLILALGIATATPAMACDLVTILRDPTTTTITAWWLAGVFGHLAVRTYHGTDTPTDTFDERSERRQLIAWSSGLFYASAAAGGALLL